ncbi:MAG: hypothetical protein IT445_08760 [Phycisphaeraceae bacterium]|nr:hypothetical protein [Phycisphaeraceae bacterium]
MQPLPPTSRILVLYSEPLSPDLDHFASEEGWWLQAYASRAEALRKIWICQAQWLLFQVNEHCMAETLALLASLRQLRRVPHVAAWSECYSPTLERLVRSTGANLYAAGSEGLVLIRDVLIEQMNRSGPSAIHGPPVRARSPDP